MWRQGYNFYLMNKPTTDESESDDGIERINQDAFHDFQLEKEIKEECDKLIKKYFDDRKYVDSKVIIWGDALLNDLEDFCKTKSKYKFCLNLRISAKNSFHKYYARIQRRKKKDGNLDFKYKLPYLDICFDILYIEKYYERKKINFDIYSFQKKMKNIISNIIDERSYSEEKMSEYAKYILDDSRKNIYSIYDDFSYFTPCIITKNPKLTTFCNKAVNFTDNEFCFPLKYSTNEIWCEIHYFIYNP